MKLNTKEGIASLTRRGNIGGSGRVLPRGDAGMRCLTNHIKHWS